MKTTHTTLNKLAKVICDKRIALSSVSWNKENSFIVSLPGYSSHSAILDDALALARKHHIKIRTINEPGYFSINTPWKIQFSI